MDAVACDYIPFAAHKSDIDACISAEGNLIVGTNNVALRTVCKEDSYAANGQRGCAKGIYADEVACDDIVRRTHEAYAVHVSAAQVSLSDRAGAGIAIAASASTGGLFVRRWPCAREIDDLQ